MGDGGRVRAALDRSEVGGVVTEAFYCRDTGEWERLAECYHPDGEIRSSWFCGSPAEFIERSREMVARHKPGEVSKHMMAAPRVRVRGERALVETDVILHQRRLVEGHEFDFQTWSRYLDMVERRGGAWRVWKRTAIYEKDRMDPHRPHEIPASFWESVKLEGFPPAIRYHCWRNARSGHPVSPRIVLAKTEGERALRAEAEAWLAGGGASGEPPGRAPRRVSSASAGPARRGGRRRRG